MKLQVLLRISRNFGLKVFSPLAPMTAPANQCKSCRVERFFLPSGRSKDLVFAEGESRLGQTVVLRGGPADELQRVKFVLRRFLLLYANAKYEAEYLLLTDVAPAEPARDEEEKDAWFETLSPYVRVKRHQEQQPVLPKAASHEREDRLAKILEQKSADERTKEETKNETEKENVNPKKESIAKTVLEKDQMIDMTHRDLHDQLSNHRIQGFRRPVGNRQSSHRKPEKNVRAADPDQKPPKKQEESKSFPVLFASFCPGSKAQPFYCILPWIVNMHFYGANDLSLGSFLRLFCFTDTYRYEDKKC